MPYYRFVMYDLGGSFIWALAYLLAGFFGDGDLAKRSARFFAILGHFAAAIFVLMVAQPHVLAASWKQRRFLLSVRELRLEPEELLRMIQDADRQGNIPPYIVDLRHPLDYLPDPRVLPHTVRVSPPISPRIRLTFPATATSSSTAPDPLRRPAPR